MMTYLVKVIFIYSAFGVPLGNPVYMIEDYPNAELCEAYKQKFMNVFPQDLSLEYKAFAQSTCMTQEEFAEFMGQSPDTEEGTPSPE